MANEYINKVVLGSETLIDLTGDDISASDILSGKKAHLPSGAPVTGTCQYDANTSDATATAAEILNGKTAYKAGSKVTGSMPNIGKQTGKITAKAQSVIISKGYHDGSGAVSIDSTEQAKIVAGNIKNGVKILGVDGTYTGSELIKATAGEATPTLSAQTILPSDEGDFDYFTQFIVDAIPVTRVDNTAGGITVSIAS